MLFPGYIDLSTWSVIQYEMLAQPDAVWTVDPSLECVTQSVNGDPSIFLSDFDITDTRITGTMEAAGPDYMGFVFGYQDRGHYYLFDWKKTTESYLSFGTAELGASLRIIDVQGGGDPTCRKVILSCGS